MNENKTSLFNFPCAYVFKIIGTATNAFEAEVVGIIRRHFPQLGEGSVKLGNSKQGKYLSLTINVNADSQAQVDAVYQDLAQSELVLFSL